MSRKDPLLDARAAQPSPQPTPAQQVTREIRRRQRSRAIIMAVCLFAFVILVYFISIAKMAAYG